jgi:hypothetical protein
VQFESAATAPQHQAAGWNLTATSRTSNHLARTALDFAQTNPLPLQAHPRIQRIWFGRADEGARQLLVRQISTAAEYQANSRGGVRDSFG